MDLKLKEVAKLLQVSEKTIYRWVSEEKIPFYRINHQYRFRSDEIHQWSLGTKYQFTAPTIEGENGGVGGLNLVDALQKGGIYYNVAGGNTSEVLKNSVNTINFPQSLSRDLLLNKLEEREQMASTAIGDGIAFPHPRVPIINRVEDECIALCFLHNLIDFNAPDGQPVQFLFFILSANQTRHLRLMSKLSHCCRQQPFIELLNQQPLREDIYSYINTNTNS